MSTQKRNKYDETKKKSHKANKRIMTRHKHNKCVDHVLRRMIFKLFSPHDIPQDINRLFFYIERHTHIHTHTSMNHTYFTYIFPLPKKKYPHTSAKKCVKFFFFHILTLRHAKLNKKFCLFCYFTLFHHALCCV